MRYKLQTAAGTNLYAWCGNNPVTREDPSGMAWNFRSIGARLMGGVGAAIGSFIDYSIGYVSGYVGGGGYSGYGYSGGGYGYSGYRGGSKTKKAVQAAVKAKPAMKLKGPSVSVPSRATVINNLRNLSVAGIKTLAKSPIKIKEEEGANIWNSLGADGQRSIYEEYRNNGYVETDHGSPVMWQHVDWNKYEKHRQSIDTSWALNCYANLAVARIEKFYDPISVTQLAECYFEPYGVTLNMEPFMYYDYNPVPSGN
ncbi:MAG: hypothetical protein ACYC4D_09055 [Thermoleophilia bacterium]